ncbi:EAL domain-containing protein [Paraburkholderia franconis]|nr:EAL domain-containing protein [Paraburkholderia franconis]
MRKLFAFRKPAFAGRGVTPTLALIVAVACGMCVIATAVIWGKQAGDESVRERESLIARDMVVSIDRILDNVVTRRRVELRSLPGQSCALVAYRLAELKTYVHYVRAIDLVGHRRLYCSSALGPIDVPLLDYLQPAPSGITIGLAAGTFNQPDTPVMPLYVSTGPDTGLLYVVEAAYLADALAHGVRYEADHVVLVVSNTGALNNSGNMIPADSAAARQGTRASSTRWAFSIAVVAAPEFVSHAHWKYGLLAGAAALLVNLLIAAAWLIAFAPRRLMLAAVRRGLKQGQLHLAYQPIVEIATRRIAGVEALIRWTHPKWGPVNPGVFMVEVERSSLLPRITRFALERASDEIAHKTKVRPLRLAVNIAPMDLERDGFVADVLAVNQKLPDDITLVLELTERLLLQKHPRTEAIFQRLKAHGVKFAIDDFGTQHSNLDLLGRFPFDYVKIDGQFVRQIDKKGYELIRAIAGVAKHYGMEVIAEGVETAAQHEALRSLGIPFGQGYFYQRPVPVSALFVDADTTAQGASVVP